jgi:hypothetical protein
MKTPIVTPLIFAGLAYWAYSSGHEIIGALLLLPPAMAR